MKMYRPPLLAAACCVTIALLTGSAKSASAHIDGFAKRRLGASHFLSAEVDLNADQIPETILYITDPDFCGSGGCTMFVLSSTDRGFWDVSRITAVRLPISVLLSSTHGWRDLGVGVSGGGLRDASQARLRFDGTIYPGNPTMRPAIRGHFRGKIILK